MSVAFVFLFWLALTIPGYALLRALRSELLQAGFLGVASVSVLVTLTLLSPISLIGYALRLPLEVFSGSIVVAVLSGLVVIARQGWWPDVRKLLATAFAIEMLVVLLHLWAAARTGGSMAGDSAFHVGRIRFLIDHGLSNRDFYLEGDFFIGIYHSNIYHAVLASCAQLTGLEAFEIWIAMLPCAHALMVGGMFVLGWSMFGTPWAGWLSGFALIASRGPIQYCMYPNQLAPYWLLPMGIAFVVRLAGKREPWLSAFGVGAVSLALGQVHGLFAVFLGVATGVYLGGRTLWGWARGEGVVSPPLVAGLGLFAAVPLIAYGLWAHPEQLDAGGLAAPWASNGPLSPTALAKAHFVAVEDGVQFDVSFSSRIPWLLLAFAIGVIRGRRREVVVVLLGLVTIAGMLYVPPVAERVVLLAGAPWKLARAYAVLGVLTLGVLPGALVMPWTAWVRSANARGWISIGFFVFTMSTTASKDWKTHAHRAISTRSRDAGIQRLRNNQRFFREEILAGRTVLTTERAARNLVMLHDVYVLAALNAHRGGRYHRERVRDLNRWRKSQLSWKQTRRILLRYGVEQALFFGKHQVPWKGRHVESRTKKGQYSVYTFKPVKKKRRRPRKKASL